jgi:hypothetical protein
MYARANETQHHKRHGLRDKNFSGFEKRSKLPRVRIALPETRPP